jgi:hypothetical protein
MTAAELAASLKRIGQVQPHLPGATAVLLAIVALGAVAPGIWLVTRHLTVMAHEGAHATLASTFGHRIDGITFASNAAGLTTHHGNSDAIGKGLITFVGYLGPSAFGLGAAKLINAGHSVAVLWIGLAGLFGILLCLRKSFGVVSVTAAFVLLFLVAGFARVGVQVVTAYLLAWFLLASSVRIIRIRGAGAKDAQKLSDSTGVPATFWSDIWELGALAALVYGAILLV